MKQRTTLLEPGVGRGEFLRIFKNLGMKVSGLDIDDQAKDFYA